SASKYTQCIQSVLTEEHPPRASGGCMRQGIPGIRRAGVAVLAAVTATLSLGILPFAQSAHANASFSFTRLGGVNRDDTGRIIATSGVFSGATNPIVARDAIFPDDLAATYNAGDPGKTPILITPPGSLSFEISARRSSPVPDAAARVRA